MANDVHDTEPYGGPASTEYEPEWLEDQRLATSYEGYCPKCRKRRRFDGPAVELASGRWYAQGYCPRCGNKVHRILNRDDVFQFQDYQRPLF